MKAKTKFLKMYNKLPSRAKEQMVYMVGPNLLSMFVCSVEIRNDTELGKKILEELGYQDD